MKTFFNFLGILFVMFGMLQGIIDNTNQGLLLIGIGAILIQRYITRH